MRWLGLLLLGLATLASGRADATLDSATSPHPAALPAGVCRIDQEVGVARLREIDHFAGDFMARLLGPDPASAAADMAVAEGQESPAAALRRLSSQIKAAPGARAVTLAHTYFIDSKTAAVTPVFAFCGKGDIRGRPSFLLGAALEEAHVLLDEDVANGRRQFDVWLWREESRWKVRGVGIGMSEMAGRDDEALWAEAKIQRARGHDLNAALLYFAAAGGFLAGDYYRPPGALAFAADANSFQPPPEIRGAPPYHWLMRGQSFTVDRVEIVAVDKGGLALIINQPSPAWNGEADADARNRRTLEAFRVSHPEWVETFAALAVRSAMPAAGQYFGTVYDRDTGYLQAPKTAATSTAQP